MTLWFNPKIKSKDLYLPFSNTAKGFDNIDVYSDRILALSQKTLVDIQSITCMVKIKKYTHSLTERGWL